MGSVAACPVKCRTFFETENEDIDLEKAYFWNVKDEYSIFYRGPTQTLLFKMIKLPFLLLHILQLTE
jgi:hypothetical protein